MDGFVGRTEQRRALQAAVERAAAGAGGWVLVSGEAGLGKTRLVDVALAARPGRCVWSAARETEQQVPYRLWLPVLRALDPAAPDLLRRLRDGGGRGPADRADLHDDVTGLVLAAARERLLVVVLEDLHWADPDSWALLGTMAPALRAAPVLLLTTSRTPAPPGAPGPRPDLHLPLGPLTAEEVAELADRLGAPASLRPDLHARTGGNPLFVVELVAAARAGAHLPPSVAAGVAERLRGAGPDAAAVATATAVLGEEAGLDELLAVAEGTAGLAPDRSRAGLTRLVDARLLVPVPGAVLRYRFPHALLREAVLGGLSTAERGRTSAVAAGVLRRAGAAPGRLAPLVVAAASAGAASAGEARDALRAAAAAAEEVCAWDQAAALREQAAAWADAAGTPDHRPVLEHADALARAGHATAARARHLEAASRARAAGDPEGLALAALGLSGGLGGTEVPLRDREQVELLDEALGALPAGPLRAHVRARRSVAVTFLEDEDRRARDAQAALAEAGDDDRAAVAALSALADARAGPRDVDLRARLGAEMVARGARAGSPEHEMLGLRVRLVAELERGDVYRAAATVAAHGDLAERLGQARYRWYAPLWRGALELLRGDVAAARTANAEARALGERAGSGNAVVLTLSQEVCVAIVARETSAVRALLAPVLLEHSDLVGPRVADAWARVVAGDGAAARAALDRLVGRDLPDLPVDAEWLPTVALLADAVARAGAADLAHPLLERLRPWSDLFVVDGIVDAVLGPAATSVGALAALAGQADAADELFAAGLGAAEAVGAALAAADAREAWGTALLRGGRAVERGRELLRAASAWRAAAGLAVPAPEPLEDVAVLARNGDGWCYERGNRRGALPALRGLELLAVLLATPGEEVRAVDLDGRAVREEDLGPALDRRAQVAYRARLAELGEQEQAARVDGDADRVARVRSERDALEGALREALGLHGRGRPQGSSAERARTSVTKALRGAVRRIGDVDPLVGEHLAASLRTGAWCSYRPDPATRVTWRLSR